MKILQLSKVDQAHAKTLGAYWNPIWRHWLVSEENQMGCQKWWKSGVLYEFSKAPLNSPRLYVDLVPQTSWGQNLAQTFKGNDWDMIRYHVYDQYDRRCAICQETGYRGRLDAHERWEYHPLSQLQILVNIEALCPSCHLSTHMGFARVSGREPIAMAHLAFVNRWSMEEVTQHVQQSFHEWARRSQRAWHVRLDWLQQQCQDRAWILTSGSQKKLACREEKWYLSSSV